MSGLSRSNGSRRRHLAANGSSIPQAKIASQNGTSWLICRVHCRWWMMLLGLVTSFATHPSIHAQVQENDHVADLLGLEPSEYGRLLAANPLLISDTDLQTALTELGDRPFRLLPQSPTPRVIRIQGNLERIVRHPLRDSLDNSVDESRSIYEVQIRTIEANATPEHNTPAAVVATVRILTRHVPEIWRHLPWQKLEDGRMEWRSGGTPELTLNAAALVFVLGDKQLLGTATPSIDERSPAVVTSDDKLLTGVAKRIEWPEKNTESLLQLGERAANVEAVRPSPSSQPQIQQTRQRSAETWSVLGAAGFDLGLWDLVAQSHRRELLASDNEPFYQLLAASLRCSPPTGTELPVRDLIRQPHQFVGHSFRILATIKQVTRVPSDPDDRAAQLGIAEYYLLHGVIQLPRPLRLKFDGERQIAYQQHFPIVIATTKLPVGLAVGDDVRQWVSGDGLLFKLWSYESLRSQAAGVDQWAPLMVSNNLELSGPPTDTTAPWPISGLLLIPVGAGLLFLLVFGLRGVSRRS